MQTPPLLEAAKAALELIKATWIEDHGNRQVGETWGLLERAIAAAENNSKSPLRPADT